MDELVIEILEGRGFPSEFLEHGGIFVQCRFNSTLQSSPVECRTTRPKWNHELKWRIDRRRLDKLKAQTSHVKLLVMMVEATEPSSHVPSRGRHKPVGFVLLDFRSAAFNARATWYPLLDCRLKDTPQLKVNCHLHSASRSRTERVIQLGEGNRLFNVVVTLDGCTGLVPLRRHLQLHASEGLYFSFKIFGQERDSQVFGDLSQGPHSQQFRFQIISDPEELSDYFSEHLGSLDLYLHRTGSVGRVGVGSVYVADIASQLDAVGSQTSDTRPVMSVKEECDLEIEVEASQPLRTHESSFATDTTSETDTVGSVDILRIPPALRVGIEVFAIGEASRQLLAEAHPLHQPIADTPTPPDESHVPRTVASPVDNLPRTFADITNREQVTHATSGDNMSDDELEVNYQPQPQSPQPQRQDEKPPLSQVMSKPTHVLVLYLETIRLDAERLRQLQIEEIFLQFQEGPRIYRTSPLAVATPEQGQASAATDARMVSLPVRETFYLPVPSDGGGSVEQAVDTLKEKELLLEVHVAGSSSKCLAVGPIAFSKLSSTQLHLHWTIVLSGDKKQLWGDCVSEGLLVGYEDVRSKLEPQLYEAAHASTTVSRVAAPRDVDALEGQKRHFRLSVDLRSVRDFSKTTPWVYLRYKYPHFGSSGMERTAPLMTITQGMENLLNDGFRAFEFGMSSARLYDIISHHPLLVEVWQKDRYVEDKLVGLARVPLLNVLQSAPRPSDSGVSRSCDCFVPIELPSDVNHDDNDDAESENPSIRVQRVGVLRVVLSLEDFGALAEDEAQAAARAAVDGPAVQSTAAPRRLPDPRKGLSQKVLPAAIAAAASSVTAHARGASREPHAVRKETDAESISAVTETTALEETEEYAAAWELEVWKRAEEQRHLSTLRAKEAARMDVLEQEWRKRERQREAAHAAKQKRLADVEARLKATLSDVEKREAKLVASEEDLQRKRDTLQNEYNRKLVEVQDACRRMKEEYTHQSGLARARFKEVEQRCERLETELASSEGKRKAAEVELEKLKEWHRETPESLLREEVSRLRSELQDRERKLADVSAVKDQYRSQLDKALREVGRLRQLRDREAHERLQQKEEELRQDQRRLRAEEEAAKLRTERLELEKINRDLAALRKTSVPKEDDGTWPPRVHREAGFVQISSEDKHVALSAPYDENIEDNEGLSGRDHAKAPSGIATSREVDGRPQNGRIEQQGGNGVRSQPQPQKRVTDGAVSVLEQANSAGEAAVLRDEREDLKRECEDYLRSGYCESDTVIQEMRAEILDLSRRIEALAPSVAAN